MRGSHREHREHREHRGINLKHWISFSVSSVAHFILFFFACCPCLLAQSTVPTTGPVFDVLTRELQHQQRVQQRLQKYPNLDLNPYVRLDLSIAERFIDRVRGGRGKGDSEKEWKLLQMDEVGDVLKDIEK